MNETTDQTKTSIEHHSIELVADNGQGLFVNCQWQIDRFVQVIGLIADQKRRPVMLSSEGSPQEFWPVSPPLQQVHRQEIENCPVLFGVGMAGASHYSTSMLLSTNGSLVELQIDSACVAKSPAGVGEIHLGSRVNCLPEFDLVQCQREGQLVRGNECFPGILIIPDRETCQLQQLESRQLEFTPLAIQESGPTQWRYRLTLQ